MGSVDERFIVEFDTATRLAALVALERYAQQSGGKHGRDALRAVQLAIKCPSLAELGREFGGL